MVGATGFEPVISRSQSERLTGLGHAPTVQTAILIESFREGQTRYGVRRLVARIIGARLRLSKDPGNLSNQFLLSLATHRGFRLVAAAIRGGWRLN